MEAIPLSGRLCQLSMSHLANPKSHTLTRRSLLRNGAATTAAALLGGAIFSTATAAASTSHLQRSSYTGLVGQSFWADSVELSLLSVSDVAGAKSAKSLAGSEDAFVLTFSGPRNAALKAGTHTFRHSRLGEFELFVSPVGRQADRVYEAVIDRSVGV